MNINELIKGIIIGVAKVIPGFSGAVLMISFNLYDRAIEAITNFFADWKKNLLFLLNLGIGILLGVVLFSKVIGYFIHHYYLYTTMLFLGLIIGGIPVIGKKVRRTKMNAMIMVGFFLGMCFLALMNPSNTYVLKNTYMDYLVFFGAGLLEAVGTVLPGISSTALLMLIGVYSHYISGLANLLNLAMLKSTLYFLLPFSLGLFVGVIVISLVVNFLFRYYQEKTFAMILGISFSSVVVLLIQLFPHITSVGSCLGSLLLLGMGYFITKHLV